MKAFSKSILSVALVTLSLSVFAQDNQASGPDSSVTKKLHPLQPGSMRGDRPLGLKKQIPSSKSKFLAVANLTM